MRPTPHNERVNPLKKPLPAIIAALVALAMLAGACSKPQQPDPQADRPVRGGTFTIAAARDAMMLNPILAQDSASTFINRLLYDSLLRMDDKFQFQPGLADGLPTIEDGGRKWTFHLRHDVKFSDGQPLSSKDVRFTFEAILHPGFTGPLNSNFDSLKGVATLHSLYGTLHAQVTAGKLAREVADQQAADAWDKWRRESGAIQTPDPYTVIFSLDTPFAPLLTYLGTTGILPEHKLRDEIGSKMQDALFNRSPVGSGRYTLGEWRPGERIILKANDAWWGGRPNIDELVWRILPSTGAAMEALETGAADSAEIDPARAEHFVKEVKHVQVLEFPTTVYSHVALDLNSDLFRDVRVRQAMAYALNKEALVERVLDGHGLPAWSHGTPARWDYNPDVSKYLYDLTKAIVLLQDAGWERQGDGIRARDGKRFAFTLYFNAAQQRDQDTARFIQSAWRTAGLDVTVKGVDFATLLALTDPSDTDRKQPQAYMLGWELGSEPDSYSLWACDGKFNDIGYCNLRVDSLVKQGRIEPQQAKRTEIYGQVQALLAEDQPYIWLYFPNAIQGINVRVHGPITGTPAGLFWNFEQWWIPRGG